MIKKAKKMGRPPKPAHLRKNQKIEFRVTDKLYDQLAKFAKRSGHSISEEVLMRLAVGSDENVALLKDIASAVANEPGWKDNQKAAEEVETALRIILNAHVLEEIPSDLLESDRHGPVRGRILAHVILKRSMPYTKGGDLHEER